MSNLFVLLGREFRSYFLSPIAYIIIAFFLAFCGFYFALQLQQTQQASLRYVLGPIAFITLMVAPVISMRLIAEERRNGTLETLLTAPVTNWEVVLAKFLGAQIFYLSLLLPTLGYLLIFWYFGGNWPLYSTFTFYLGLTLLSGAYLSIGLFISALTVNQIVASFVTFISLLVVYLMVLLGRFLPPGAMSSTASYASFVNHLESFKRGVLDSQDIIYFLTIIVFFLFLTVQVLKYRRESTVF